MPKAQNNHTVTEHFERKEPIVRAIYSTLLAAVRKFGPVTEDPKKTSIHLNRKSALVGVYVRKAHLVLTLKSDRASDSPRIHKSEQVSASRFYHELKLSSPGEIDKELQSWLKIAYDLSA